MLPLNLFCCILCCIDITNRMKYCEKIYRLVKILFNIAFLQILLWCYFRKRKLDYVNQKIKSKQRCCNYNFFERSNRQVVNNKKSQMLKG